MGEIPRTGPWANGDCGRDCRICVGSRLGRAPLPDRRCAGDRAPEDLPNVDVVLVSHRHFDHLSSGTFALIEPKIPTVLTAEGVQQDIPSGAYVVKELRYGDSWKRDGLRITAVPVDHNG